MVGRAIIPETTEQMQRDEEYAEMQREEGDAGHEEEQVSQVDESQGAHGDMGKVEGSRYC